MDDNVLKQMPKVELHCHLDGSLSADFIRSRLKKAVTMSQLQVDEDCRSLSEYLEKFDIPLQCLQDEQGLRGAGYDFIKSVAEENVRYVEVRFAPMLSANEKLQPESVIQSVLEGLEEGRRKFGTDYNVIVCAMRHHTEEQNRKMLRAARTFLGEGVCAADLAGDESYPMSQFIHLFTDVNKLGMPYTIHAGETGNVQNITDAVNVGARRIGHGIAMKGNTDVQKLCKDKRIGIEMCPISNLQTKAVSDPEDYPLREFLEAGLLVSINTDNRTVSGSTLTKELGHIQEKYKIQDEEIKIMMKNAIESSFADDAMKEKLYRYY